MSEEVKQLDMCVTPQQSLANLVVTLAIILAYSKNRIDHELEQHLKISVSRRRGGEPFAYGNDFNVTSTWPAGTYLNIDIDWGYFPKKVFKAAMNSGKKALIYSTKTEYNRFSHYVFRLSDNPNGMKWMDKIKGVYSILDEPED